MKNTVKRIMKELDFQKLKEIEVNKGYDFNGTLKHYETQITATLSHDFVNGDDVFYITESDIEKMIAYNQKCINDEVLQSYRLVQVPMRTGMQFFTDAKGLNVGDTIRVDIPQFQESLFDILAVENEYIVVREVRDEEAEKEARRKELNQIGINFRAKQLKAMHEVMLNCNDEELYMTWIYYIPDAPHHDDFESIAESREDYNEAIDIFIKLVSKDGYRA